MEHFAHVFEFLRRPLFRGWAIATILSLVVFSIVLAASGDPDTTFSGDGKQSTNFPPCCFYDAAYSVALQSNGKIVVVGTHEAGGNASHVFALARYNPAGGLDTTFSGDGRQTTNFTPGTDWAQAVAVQSNGKIVVSGIAGCDVNTSYAGCKIALARYSTDGSLDATFSGDGKHMLRIGMLDTFSHGGLVIQPNGKIVVAGTACGPDQTNCNFAVLRFNANGSLDTTFSGDGKVMIGFGSGRGDYATDLALQGDGKIVVAGSTLDSAETNCYTAVARLTSAGALDTTFSGDGKQTVNFGGTTCFSNNGGVAIDGNGRIVLGGYKATATDRYFTVARLTSAGALDTSFSGTGKKITNVTGDGEVGSVVRVAGTRILLAGRTNFAGTQDFALVRYNDNGTLDTSFSGDGLAFFDFQGDFDVARGMAIDANGKYVLVGQIFKDGQSDFGVMRVLP